MDGTLSSGTTSSWGIVIFLIILFAIFWGGGFGGAFGGRGYGPNVGVGVEGYGLGFEDYKAVCELEKQAMAQIYGTQRLIDTNALNTQALINQTANVTQAKIDYYGYQNLKDQLAESQRANMELRNQLFVKDQLAPVNATLASIQCQMLKRPDSVGIAASCTPVISPLTGMTSGCGCSSTPTAF